MSGAARWACGLAAFALAAAAEDSLPEKAAAILAANCASCHSDAARMSGLRLTSRDSLIKGGTRGPAVVPGNAAASRLYQFVSRSAQPHMPPGKPIAPDAVETLRRWIDAGAAWPAVQTAPVASTWWAFQRPKRSAVPAFGKTNPIDNFIAAKLAGQHFQSAAQASRATLIRRAYFDLTGLPPTASEVASFVTDPAPDAYEKLIQQLLDSPRYGEKWARVWLDLVRYSDTAGFELDSYISDAWRYRDWVIEAFNRDKPYDQFVKEQIAGDELAPDDPVAKTGTGYYCVGPNMDLYADQQDINRVQTLTDYVDTTGAVLMGLTFGCARCHDHKFDPIPQRDYYRLQSIFEPARKTLYSLGKLPGLSYNVSENTREIKLQELGDQIRAIESRCRNELKSRKAGDGTGSGEDAIRGCLNPQESTRLRSVEHELVGMFANYQPKPFICGVTEHTRLYPPTHIPARGGGDGPAVTPGFPSALGGGDVPEPDESAGTTGRRRALANWIGSADNPITARVAVNRIWQSHFGRGIVATPSDFGTRGAKPSHPELLDWLAVEFVEHGWSIKHLHKLIMTSAAYRQSTDSSEEARASDPENVFLSHFTRRRLTADEIRDSVLSSSGLLNPKMSGRPVVPRLSDTELFGLTGKPGEKWIVTADQREADRRAIYLFNRRTYRVPMLEVFDAPDATVTCPRREASTTSTQSLTLLNSEFMLSTARRFSARLVAEHPGDEALVSAIWSSILARRPTPAESAKALAFLLRQKENLGARESAAAELVRAIFNANEFLYVD